MSVNDLAMTIHITKDTAKKYISGKESIPEWIAIYFEELNGKTRQNSDGEKPQ
jgi:plasmid maintenance system antidote protein VapI